MSEEQSLQRLQGALDELKAINRVVDRVCRARETNHIMSIIIDELIALTSASQGVVNLLKPQDNDTMTTVIRGSPRMRPISSRIWWVAPSSPSVRPACEAQILTLRFE